MPSDPPREEAGGEQVKAETRLVICVVEGGGYAGREPRTVIGWYLESVEGSVGVEGALSMSR